MDVAGQFSPAISQVRIVREKQTGESKGFGFVQFATVKDAEDFMARTHSSLTIGGVNVRVSYSHRPRGSNYGGASRVCMTQHQSLQEQQQPQLQQQPQQPQQQQQQQQHEGPRDSHHSYNAATPNDGSRDIGQMPSSLLVVIDLPMAATEATLWETFCEFGGDAQLLPLRVFLARDHRSRRSGGFGFIEYPSVEGAVMALERAGATFKVMAKTIGLYFAHQDSFYQATEATQWAIPLGREGLPMVYWDEQVHMIPFSAAEYGATLFDAQAATIDHFKHQQQQHSHTHHPPVQDLPAVLTTAKVDKAQLDGIAAAHAAEQLAKAEDKRKRKEAAATGSKKISIQLQRWNTKQVELKKDKDETPSPMGSTQGTAGQRHPHKAAPTSRDDRANSTSSASTMTRVAIEEKERGEGEEDVMDLHDYDPRDLEDLELMACMLCQRRFKGVPELRKHQDVSDLHKKNLQDKKVIRAALIKTQAKRGLDLAKGHSRVTAGAGAEVGAEVGAGAGAGALSLVAHEQEDDEAHDEGRAAAAAAAAGEPKYRDRAAERRLVYGQPDNPLPPSAHRHGSSARGHRGPGGGSLSIPQASWGGGTASGGSASGNGREGAVVPDQPTKDGIKEDNIGNRLLKSMGWKEGQGLGKDGGGITAPVEATSYSRGAGIGAGVLLKGDQHTRGYAETAKEIARRRYEEDRQ
ncbi:hypothetical protein DFQ26_002206 [Actinomortierella ambigua]|nr:hypothetical protein DFQ26_002206 [Actinomortierella ambigua]